MDKYQENPYSKKNQYTKLKEGKNTLRLFNHISGWEYWTDEDGKRTPHRSKDILGVPNSFRPDAKSFKAFVVYNYEEGVTQVLSLTQRTIIEPLTELYWDEDWGDLSEYDIVITRKGEGLETEYMVTPKPKSEFKHKLEPVKLEALYKNEDPFDTSVTIENEELDAIAEEINEDLDSE